MKKLCIMILCLLFLLCGCQEQSDLSSQETLMITDGEMENPYVWNLFYWDAYMGNAAQLEICYQHDGTVSNISLRFDGTAYTITDESGTHTYKHLIHSPMQGPDNATYDYADIFLLSDDPEMTAERYLQAALSSSTLLQNLAPTRIIHADYHSFSRAETYGTVPEEAAHITKSFSPANRVEYKASSYYLIRTYAASSTYAMQLVERYDYNANLLCQATVKGIISEILELNDGRFIVTNGCYVDDSDLLTCYNADGSVSWQYAFESGKNIYMPYLFQKGNTIYTFGKFSPDPEYSYTDILICRFSMDGQLLQEKHLGGSDFESLLSVRETSGGFAIFGYSQSSDGDLPLSKDGFPEYFSANISDNLELSNVQPAEYNSHDTLYGYHDGQPVYSDDPILSDASTDRLPTEKNDFGHITYSIRGIFDLDGGYVIIRDHHFDHYTYNHPMRSYTPSYRELIITGYDSSGNAVWQTTSEIYVA